MEDLVTRRLFLGHCFVVKDLLCSFCSLALLRLADDNLSIVLCVSCRLSIPFLFLLFLFWSTMTSPSSLTSSNFRIFLSNWTFPLWRVDWDVLYSDLPFKFGLLWVHELSIGTAKNFADFSRRENRMMSWIWGKLAQLPHLVHQDVRFELKKTGLEQIQRVPKVPDTVHKLAVTKKNKK